MDKKKELVVGVFLTVAFVLIVVFLLSKNQNNLTTQKQTTPQSTATSTTTQTGYTLAEVKTHNTAANCWFVVDGKVYDVTAYETKHPGGAADITDYCGKDATDYYNNERKHGARADAILATLLIGTLSNE